MPRRHRSEPIEKTPCLLQGVFLWTRGIFLQRNRGRRMLLTDTVGFLFQQSAQRGLVDLGLLTAASDSSAKASKARCFLARRRVIRSSMVSSQSSR